MGIHLGRGLPRLANARRQRLPRQSGRDEAARASLEEAVRVIAEAYERSTGQPVEPDRAQGWVDTAMSDYDARRDSLAWSAMEDRA
jgi:hypothetical protein